MTYLMMSSLDLLWKAQLGQRKCGYSNVGNTIVVKRRVADMKLDVSHLPQGQNWALGKVWCSPKYSLDEILVENSMYTSMTTLRRRLCKELGWEHKCNSCKNVEWLGRPIPLEVEHKNGIHDDNRITNLEFLCPTCHALTSTYKGKNMRNKEEKRTTCVSCGNTLTTYSKRCVDCCKSNKKFKPTYEVLKQEIENTSVAADARKSNKSIITTIKTTWIKIWLFLKKFKGCAPSPYLSNKIPRYGNFP